MAFPPSFLLQPSVSLALHSSPSSSSSSSSSSASFSSGLFLGPRRTEQLGRSSSGSAFAPYAASAAVSPGFTSHLPFSPGGGGGGGGDPRPAALNPFMTPGYDPSSSTISVSLDYHPFGPLGAYPYGDPAYRKNATRDATATLKAWLGEHRKNPYPTKGEKIMLAIITKMSLTQVSTWFANARRRLKKENKMTWTPRNRSEDEDEEDNVELERREEDEEAMKTSREETKMKRDEAAGDSCALAFDSRRSGDTDLSFTRPDFAEFVDRRPPNIPGSASTEAPPPNTTLGTLDLTSSPTSKTRPDSCGAIQGPKPKLWSLAEIATSSDKKKGYNDSLQSGGAREQEATPTPRTLFAHSPAHSSALQRHLYYTSPFSAGLSNSRPLGALDGINGLQQAMQQHAEVMARDCKRRSENQLQLHELTKGMTHV